MKSDIQHLTQLVRAALVVDLESIDPLRAHASARRIYRLKLIDGRSYVGIVNDDVQENRAFTGFSESFRKVGLNVPTIIASDHETTYIETDLGDKTLMDILKSPKGDDSEFIVGLYQTAIDHLLKFQTNGMSCIDKTLCYQGVLFDGGLVEKDIQYFCNEYLRRIGLWGDIKDDFSADIADLIRVCGGFDRGYFMHRDFQSRNIMICDHELYFIDYQSGREGPLQYDLASLLFQSKANLPYSIRERLLEYYLDQSKIYFEIDPDAFKESYLVFVLVRALQNLGAYGKLGLGQGKEYFKTAIPFALRNCEYLLNHWPGTLECPNLRSKLEKVVRNVSADL